MIIDIKDNSIMLDSVELTFPIALEEVEAALGKPDRVVPDGEHKMLYIYHELGMIFEARVNDDKWFKYRKVVTDAAHNITGLSLYCGDRVRAMFDEKALPQKTCKAKVTQKGGPLWFISDRAETEELHMICWTEYGYSLTGKAENISAPLTISYCPKREREPANYKIKKCKEEVLEFDNFNFKLAVVQVLMYDLEVLEPYFDIFDFAMQYTGKEIDTDSFKVSKPVLNFFSKLPVPKSLALQVEEIVMDGGNEIYANIFPMWDGEDDFFALNTVSEKELKQFSNLKKATLMSSNYKEVSKVFENLGIEVEEL